MSSGVLFIVAAAGIAVAIAAIFIATRALKQTKTVEVFEHQPQKYMLQAEPPSLKVQTMALPKRDTELDRDRVRERQA